jgi:tRNA dimethylallyltransferase
LKQINTQRPPLIVFVGPTGVGKSRLALDLARVFNAEIVNADSRQIYHGMDIGTAKPSLSERSTVPHHLFDIINPDQEFSLADFQKLAMESIRAIHSRGRLPFLVGGSGQYVWAILEGWSIPKVAPDWEYRQQLEAVASEQGGAVLFQKLEQLDPVSARAIDSRNLRRVIRALEVCHLSGHTFSEQKLKSTPPFKILILGLTADRKSLYTRVDTRVDDMLLQGFVAEVQSLILAGYSSELASMNSIGYQPIAAVVRGELSLAEAASRIKMDTHRFVRHQYAWFRLKDPRICWFDLKSEPLLESMRLIDWFLHS